MDLVKFSELAGVGVYYDRRSLKDYGFGQRTAMLADQRLIDALEKTFTKLWEFVGKPHRILSAGAYTDKPGWHGKGLGFDLDGLGWHDRQNPFAMAVPFTAKDYAKPAGRRLYIGIEAVLRATFPGTILNYNYNAAHQDHWHMQMDGVQVFRKTRSQVLWLQDALNLVLGGEPLVVDGAYGPKTQRAEHILKDVNGYGWAALSDLEYWSKFCLDVAQELLK